jgi:hypothetical protein
MKILLIVLLLLQHPIDGKESVIFEQLGTLIGATSYLHVHLDINLNAIQEQLMRYSDVLQHQFTNISTTVAYLTNYMTFNTENRTEEKMVKYQMQASALSFMEIASLHHREVGELNRLVMALQVILPDVEAKEKQRRKNMEINLPIRPFESQLHEDDQEDDPRSDPPDKARISRLRVESKKPILTPEQESHHEIRNAILLHPNMVHAVPATVAVATATPAPKKGKATMVSDQKSLAREAEEKQTFEDMNLSRQLRHYQNKLRQRIKLTPAEVGTVKFIETQLQKIPASHNRTAWDLLQDPDLGNIHKLMEESLTAEDPGPSAATRIANRMFRKVSGRKRRLTSPALSQLEQFHQILSRTWSPTLARFQRELQTFSERSLVRKKRVAGLIALPIAVAATAMGIYNSVQIEFLKAELSDVRSEQDRLFNIVRDLSGEVNTIYNALDEIRTSLAATIAYNPAMFDARLSRIDNQLRNRIGRATHAIQSAMFRRLSVDYLTPHELKKVFERVQQKAIELDYQLLIDHHTDLFQVESTLLFDGDDAHILIHVPMAPRAAILNLYQLQPFPLPFFEGHYLIPDVKQDILGLSANDHRMGTILSSQDLVGCHRVNQRYMCSAHGVLSKNLTNTCLGALYLQNFPLAQQICRFEITPVEERIYQLRKNWYIAYLVAPTTVPIRCQNGTI